MKWQPAFPRSRALPTTLVLRLSVTQLPAWPTSGAGVALPLLPTTPFVLLALWASARGSPELHARIRRHPRYRELIHAWENGRGIPRRAKYAALALLAISWLGLWLRDSSQVLLSGTGIAFTVLAAIILTRPETGYCDD